MVESPALMHVHRPGQRKSWIAFTASELAWIGASGAVTSPAMSAPEYAAAVSNSAGSCVWRDQPE